MAHNNSGLSPWMRNGRASFLAWVIALVAYVACRFAKIEAPEVTYGLIGFTGLLIGNLGLAQGKRTAKMEERSVQTRRRVTQLEDDAAESEPVKIARKVASNTRKITRLQDEAAVGRTRTDHIHKRQDIADVRADISEVRADISEDRADVSEGRADVSETRADRSQDRESEWSLHRDHNTDHDDTYDEGMDDEEADDDDQ